MAKTRVKTIDASTEAEVKPVTEKVVETEEVKTKPAKALKQSKQSKKAAVKKFRSQKYQEASAKVDKNQKYPLIEAIELAKQTSYSKFPATIELHINTNQKSMRGLITLPFSAGKKLTVLAFGDGAADSGADIVGDDEKLAEIEKGKINFDVVVTTPAWMPKLARVARVLGPRGLMPNPKSGTITDDLKKAVAELQGGKTEYKTQANSQVIHLSVGKISQPTEEIASNIRQLYMNIGKSKISKLVVAATMGPGVKIAANSI